MILTFNFFSLIIALFFLCSPSTVSFAVIAIIINSVYRSIFSMDSKMFHVTLIHISMKFFKIFPKKFNASSSIMMVVYSFRIICSLLHSTIYAIKSCSAESMTKTIGSFFSKATTGFTVSLLDIFKNSSNFISARTKATYNEFLMLISSSYLDNFKSSVNFTDAFSLFHKNYYNMVLTQKIT